jgi:hypothetical protein
MNLRKSLIQTVEVMLVIVFLAGCSVSVTPTTPPTSAVTPTSTVTPTYTPTETHTPRPPTATPLPPAGRIYGKVYLSDSGEPVSGVTMILFSLETGRALGVGETKTDSKGSYFFNDVQPGPYLLMLSLSKIPEYQDYPFCTDHLEEGWHAFLNVYTQEYPITLQAPDMEFAVLAGDNLQKDVDLKGIGCK